MALHVPKAPGVSQMLKEGARLYSGLEESVYRNISACKQLAQTVKSSYGPRGLNKMIINHLEKLFVTNDAATIIRELEVEHPAAKLVVYGSQMQEQEIGDGTNFVIIFAGALVEQAEDLLRMGLTPSEVCGGYEMALKKALEILPGLVCYEVKDIKDEGSVEKALKTTVMSKQYGNEEFLTKLITKACVSILPEETTFNVDNVRVCKISGSSLLKSEVVQGMVFPRHVEGEVSKKQNVKVAVYSCPFDTMQTETKGTVLIHTAEELMNFSKGEETMLEQQVKAIADAGCGLVVAAGKYGEMALHYLNKYGVMAVRLTSKFDLRRLCRVVGATALPRMTTPSSEEIGFCDYAYVDELGDTSVVVFKQEGKESRISTIVIRGATDNYMDDVERAVDDGINTFKGLARDGKFLPGAGAVEIELAKQITQFGETCPGLEQYSIKKFAQALEALPKTLAENAGMKPNEVISKLYATHQDGKKNVGVNIEDDGDVVSDAAEAGIIDLYLSKFWGLKYATNAARTVLIVDQVFMAKPAGGPKAPKNKDYDED